MNFRLCAITTISLLLLFGCSGNETYTEEVIDGVRHVHNLAPLQGEKSGFDLEFTRQIGDLNTEDDNYAFHSIRDVNRDSEGNIYITDSGNFRVQKFSSEGKYLLSIGSQGEGPGEFTRPYNTDISSDRKLYISDVGKMHVFNLNGEFERTFRLTNTTIRFKNFKNGNILMERGIFYRGRMDLAAPYLARITDTNDSTIVEVGEPADYGNVELNRYGNMYGFMIDSEDNFYFGFLFQNRIDKYSPEGKLLFKAVRPLNFELSHRIDKVDFEAGGRIYTRDAAVFSNVAAGLNIDNKDRIWVRTYKHEIDRDEIRLAKDLIFEVFDSNGILLCRVPHPDLDGRLSMCGDHLYFISYNNACVYEYRIVEK